ncbi:hypothetical protein [Serratia sp. Se-RSBMAAmG]|uniref:hypothetical protein n=1 Tax=Serratia sp. Se-RSBMAAmG TaxID=3043305 RepID=UPI0024AEC124|nr:hypothetical protein [Serratia sp. Se-RSBMAAmG]MDI6976143.1 hypothetical protein [Serratia sp. Se-RSBMAAmG]
MVYFGFALPETVTSFCIIACLILLAMPLLFNIVLVFFSMAGANIERKHFMSYTEIGKAIFKDLMK